MGLFLPQSHDTEGGKCIFIQKGPNKGRNLLDAKGKTPAAFCRAAGHMLWDDVEIMNHKLSPSKSGVNDSGFRPVFSPIRKAQLKGGVCWSFFLQND